MATGLDSLQRTDAEARARLLSNISYDVTLSLSKDPKQETFSSTSAITFDCSGDNASTFLDVNARSIHKVMLNGRELRPDEYTFREGKRLEISGLSRGSNTLTIVAEMEYGQTGVGLHRFVDPSDQQVYLHSHFEPFDAHLMYPCFDQPDLKATYSFHVTGPKDWKIVSNSPAAAIHALPSGEQLVDFAPTKTLSTYLTALVAGPFDEYKDQYNGVPLSIYCRKSLAPYMTPKELDEMFTLTKQGLAYYEQLYGVPYPFPKYDQLFVPEFNAGAMENPGCITFREDYIFRGVVTDAARENRANTILHEMAHMWFGDYVTMKWWNDLWLNESFATMMSYLALTEATRFKQAWVSFANTEKSWAARQDQLPTTHPIANDAPDTETAETNFDGITYAKGASVLRQLLPYVGRDNFFTGLRSYFSTYGWGNATLQDFLAKLAAASGKDLTTWSRLWLETTGISTMSTRTNESGGVYTSFAVRQRVPKDHPTLRPHIMNIGLYNLDASGKLIRTRCLENVAIHGSSTDIPELIGERVPDLLVLNDQDLTFTKVRFDSKSLSTLVHHLSDIPDPLTRSLCWAASWDMLRDAELSGSAFIALFAEQAPHETEVATVERLIAQAKSAATLYGHPSTRDAKLASLAQTAHSAYTTAKDGSDLQLAWFKAFIAFATSDTELTMVREYLDGTKTVPGIPVHTDPQLRWLLINRLAQAGKVDATFIEREQKRENTDLSQLRGATALAALPTKEAKEQAWLRLTADPTLSLYLREAILAGFQQPGQESLTKEYITKYFAQLPSMWTSYDHETAAAMTTMLYPSFTVSKETLAATKSAIGDARLPFSARRSLLESEDTAKRMLKARALDRTAPRPGSPEARSVDKF
ncbi:MAG: aminopeptidase N [Candidatus Dormibacteria bacterium]